jgi:hypothetical protein
VVPEDRGRRSIRRREEGPKGGRAHQRALRTDVLPRPWPDVLLPRGWSDGSLPTEEISAVVCADSMLVTPRFAQLGSNQARGIQSVLNPLRGRVGRIHIVADRKGCVLESTHRQGAAPASRGPSVFPPRQSPRGRPRRKRMRQVFSNFTDTETPEPITVTVPEVGLLPHPASVPIVYRYVPLGSVKVIVELVELSVTPFNVTDQSVLGGSPVSMNVTV